MNWTHNALLGHSHFSGKATSMIGLCQDGKSSPDAYGGARV
jgi:hypothetical protein